jgi:hypothetical protein
MDSELVAVVARSLERLVAVLFGGLTVYYGYRLFLVVPVETHSDGSVKLPGMSVVLAKAGPGLFFTAFGVIVLVTSFINPIDTGNYRGATPTVDPATNSSAGMATRVMTPQDAARAQLAVSTLNCMTRLATTGPRRIPVQDAEIAARAAKLALLSQVWEADWGNLETFRTWVNRGGADPPPRIRTVFDAENPECPK